MNHVLCERNPRHPVDTALPHRSDDRIEHRALTAPAAHAVRTAATEIVITFRSLPNVSAEACRTLTDPRLIDLVDAHAAALPESVRGAVRPPATRAGAAVLTGLPLLEDDLGPTPRDWREAAAWSSDPAGSQASFRLDITMLLLARSAGEPFGWHGQQGGRLVNNILPSPGHEHEQSGASSTTLLCPHTEDAFHPQRAHLLMLGCLRNPDRVGTTVSSVRQVRLSREQHHRLAHPRLPILPDVSYGTDFHRYPAAPVATVGGDQSRPTLRYDPAYTPLDDADDEFRSAYDHLGAELERVCHTAVLDPGELLLVDNDVVVHGRVPFTPRYDGTDRWLKRVNVRLARDRPAAESAENGYGQRTVTPFAGRAGTRGTRAHGQTEAADDQ